MIPLDIPKEGIRLLVEALRSAQAVERDPWDFAVEAESLRRAGCTNSQLRRLLCEGLLQHGEEVTSPSDTKRRFRRTRNLQLRATVCFVLTPAGIQAASALALEPPEISAQHPVWNPITRELRFGEQIIKQYRVPAENQIAVLNAFQEEQWPDRIDDPLPPKSELDRRIRLRETVKSLNRNQGERLLHFFADGTGCGICWRLTASIVDGPHATMPPHHHRIAPSTGAPRH